MTHLGMLGSQLVEDVGGIKAGIVAELPGNDLEGFCVRANQQLLLAGNGPGVVPQVLGKLHLNGPSTSHYRVVLQQSRSKGTGSLHGPSSKDRQHLTSELIKGQKLSSASEEPHLGHASLVSFVGVGKSRCVLNSRATYV